VTLFYRVYIVNYAVCCAM